MSVLEIDFVRQLIAKRCPDLGIRRLPCGGYIYFRDTSARPEPGVHLLYSPLPDWAITETDSDIAYTHELLRPAFRGGYLNILKQFNGAVFFYPRIYFYGRQDPRRVNKEDLGYGPAQMHDNNHYERKTGIPLSELMIGGIWGPDSVITVDEQRIVRLRKRTEGAEIVREFHGYFEFFDFSIDPQKFT